MNDTTAIKPVPTSCSFKNELEKNAREVSWLFTKSFHTSSHQEGINLLERDRRERLHISLVCFQIVIDPCTMDHAGNANVH
jgi:hypothetical protein